MAIVANGELQDETIKGWTGEIGWWWESVRLGGVVAGVACEDDDPDKLFVVSLFLSVSLSV